MTKISCDIIQDLLPLYCDDVCSEDSMKMVEEHLQECHVCTDMLHQLKNECTFKAKENIQNKEDSAVLGRMANSWKHSLLKSFLKGIIITTVIFSIILGAYYALFVHQGSMVSSEQVSVSAYMLSDERITFRLQLLDGYCGGTMKTFVDENNNLYISVQRTVIKEELANGEEEVMNYGFNQAEKNYLAVYYGTPDNCMLIWKQGDTLPSADANVFE